MDNIKVTRYENDPSGALGRIEYGGPGGPWSVIVDSQGRPHLWLRFITGRDDQGKPVYGFSEYFNFLPADVDQPADLIDADASCEPGDELTAEDSAEANRDYEALVHKRLIEPGYFKTSTCTAGKPSPSTVDPVDERDPALAGDPISETR